MNKLTMLVILKFLFLSFKINFLYIIRIKWPLLSFDSNDNNISVTYLKLHSSFTLV